MTFEIKKAERKAAPITAALLGDSGSGKTLSALLLGRGLVGDTGKLVMIDTEGERSLVYSDMVPGGFEHMDLTPPYSPERFTQALDYAVQQGADCIIIDSASDEWEGDEGVLDMATSEAERLKTHDLRIWKVPKIAHRKFIQRATKIPCHVILCYRKTISASMEKVNGKMEITEREAVVWDKKDKFYMQMVLELEKQTHKIKAYKLPEPYKPYIKDGDVITVEHGRAFHNESQVASVQSKPAQEPQPAQTAPPAQNTATTPPPNQETPQDYQILLASGDPLLFVEKAGLIQWLKDNVPMIKTKEQLNSFRTRNDANFKTYFGNDADLSHEVYTVFNARENELGGPDANAI